MSRIGIPSKTGRPVADQDQARSALLDAAATEFVTHGYARTTMEAIAVRARVSKKTIYRFFDGKETLYKAVVRHAATPAAPPFQRESTTEGTLTLLADWIYDLVADDAMLGLMRTVIGEGRAFPQLGVTMFTDGYDKGRGPFSPAVEVFNQLIAAGEIDLPNGEIAAEMFACLAYGGLRLVMMPADKPETRQRWVKTLVHLFLNGARRNGIA